MPRWRKVRDLHEVSGRRSRGLVVVLLFDLAFELPHCLSVSPHNQIARAARDPNRRPRILQFSSPNFHKRQHAPNVQEL